MSTLLFDRSADVHHWTIDANAYSFNPKDIQTERIYFQETMLPPSASMIVSQSTVLPGYFQETIGPSIRNRADACESRC